MDLATLDAAKKLAEKNEKKIVELTEEIDNVVHVGEDEPTDESVKLWVDPSDEGEDESNTAGVTSVNGMTGDVMIAIPSIEGLASEEYVQKALENVEAKDGEYALIETYAVTEATAQIDFAQTPAGVPYAFRNAIVIIDLPAGTYESAAYYATAYFGSTFISVYRDTAPHESSKKRATFMFEARNGKMNAQAVNFAQVYGTGDSSYTDGGATYTNGDFRVAKPITKIRVKSNKTLPAGTEIKIYGVVK